MRIDSHQHFWQYNQSDYVWMSADMDVLRRDYLPPDLQPLLDDIEFEGSIAVQARQMDEETRWLLELADQCPSIFGVVGWVDLASSQLDETLGRYTVHPKFRGVRELIHDMPDLDYAISNVHTRAIARLKSFGLTYDLLLKPEHLVPATALARTFPEQRFVVDHIAKPEIAKGLREPWARDIAGLARCENVWCKVSGMVTQVSDNECCDEALRPYLDHVLDVFGAGRLMIGSDWPVCTLAASYGQTMKIVIDFAQKLSPAERDGILGGNAAAFYGLFPCPSRSGGRKLEAV